MSAVKRENHHESLDEEPSVVRRKQIISLNRKEIEGDLHLLILYELKEEITSFKHESIRGMSDIRVEMGKLQDVVEDVAFWKNAVQEAFKASAKPLASTIKALGLVIAALGIIAIAWTARQCGVDSPTIIKSLESLK